jgi:hypothetical protein
MNVILTTAILSAMVFTTPAYSKVDVENALDTLVNGEYAETYDVNLDGTLEMLDILEMLKESNKTATAHIDGNVIDEIMKENGIDCIYYEIDFVNSVPCRKYEIWGNENDFKIHVYYETEENASGFWLAISPENMTIETE